MGSRSIKLVDPAGNVLATASVTAEGGCFAGTIDLSRTPADLRRLFEEFDEAVNCQMFSLVDGIQARIARLVPRAVFEDGRESGVRDLQVYPSTGDVSFRLAEGSQQQVAST
jgi:hypothetical protein